MVVSYSETLKHLRKVSGERDPTDRKFKMAAIEILINEWKTVHVGLMSLDLTTVLWDMKEVTSNGPFILQLMDL